MHASLRISLVLIGGILLLLTGCVLPNTFVSPLSVSTPRPTPTVKDSPVAMQPSSIVPVPGTAVVVGRAVTAETNNPAFLVSMPVRLARVFWNADKSDGAFVLEGATSPSALIQEDGSFVFLNVVPADYVIVIGDPFGYNAIITEPNGKARVITVEAGKTFNVGTLMVTLKSP